MRTSAYCTILFMGDTHSKMDPSKIFPDSDVLMGGYERIVNYVSSIHKTEDCVITLHSGDFLQGTSYFNFFKGIPDVQMLNEARVDVATLGNHEFDILVPAISPVDSLLKLINERASFSVINANIYKEGEEKPVFAPYKIIARKMHKIAVIGLLGNSAWKGIYTSKLKGLELLSPRETLDQLAENEEIKQADLVVLLSHAGIEEDLELAKHPLINLVIGGHSHKVIHQYEPSTSTPILHSGFDGCAMGRINVNFSTKKPTFDPSFQYLTPEYEQGVSKRVRDVFMAFRNQEKKYFGKVLGECVESSFLEKKLDELVPLGEITTEYMRQIAGADFATIPSGTLRGIGFSKGSFTRRDLYSFLAHDDAIEKWTITGREVLRIFKHLPWKVKSREPFQYSGITSIDGRWLIGEKEIESDKEYSMASIPFHFSWLKKNFSPGVKFHSHTLVSKDIRVVLEEKILTKGFGPVVRPFVNETESLN